LITNQEIEHKLNCEPLSNYDVVQSNKENREKFVSSQLSKNVPPQFRTQLSTQHRKKMSQDQFDMRMVNLYFLNTYHFYQKIMSY